MDPVQPVHAYLHVNGHFKVAEYPVLEACRGRGSRTVIHLDIVGYRFAGAGHDLISHGGHRRPLRDSARTVDPALGCGPGQPDVLVDEVKEGRARVDPARRDPVVLEVALTRFGCCPAAHARDIARQLVGRGQVPTEAGHVIRVVAFGNSYGRHRSGPWRIVSIGHVVRFRQAYLHENWDVLAHAQLRDAAFAVLALIQKWNIHLASAGIGKEQMP
ncbi:hypothetical protein N864_23460 [Intrasporangium chromatireducens Q5-1]|uniref:Uncharacterized protein n=1 Tax=Intrasporangium chromatireducens Q5-1 TaxID=584657 RepID=W9GRT0_9MICO|nr:hypothetical protein [Intrasporangium chromatireducens]EWT07767.1 hypothetical protein N864_23460 [Intrasporangium chromatireducens Q5-1]